MSAHSNHRDLDRLFDPRSIAVVGASTNPSRIGGRPIAYCLAAGYRGQIHPVNPSHDTIQGLTCYRDVDDLPDEIDVAIVAVAADQVVPVVAALGRKNTAFAVVYSSDFAETGEVGRDRQRELVEVGQRFGIRILGPNTNGWTSAPHQVVGSFSSSWLRPGSLPLVGGSVSFVSQSGALGAFICSMAGDMGLGFRQFAAVGNESDVSFSELLSYMVEDPEVKAVGGYLEGLRDGDDFVEVAKRANELGKPLVLMKVGRSDRGRLAAASHTAALVGSDSVYDSVFAECNVIRVEDVRQLLDVLYLVDRSVRNVGPRLAMISISGGLGVWASDQVGPLGLEMTTLAPETRAKLDAVLPAYGSSLNPVDATAQIVNDTDMLQSMLGAVLDDPNVDVCWLAMGLQEENGPVYADEVVRIAGESSTPLVVSWVCGPRRLYETFARSPLPVFDDFHRPLAAVARLARWHGNRTGAAGRLAVATEPSLPRHGDDVLALAEDEAKQRLARVGVGRVPAARRVSSAEDAQRAVDELVTPLVLKAARPDAILHKTDLGLVTTGLRTQAQLAAAIAAMAPLAAELGKSGYLFVEEQAAEGVELMVSLVPDEVFGWQLVVGLGGELVELLRESTMMRAPTSTERARAQLLRSERIVTLLAGARGRPPADIDALVELLVTISLIPGGPEGAGLRQLELNPVRVHPAGDGVSVLDAVWRLDDRSASGPS